MRRPRLVVSSELSDAYYHCISRVVGAQMLLMEPELQVLKYQMKLLAEYCGLEIVTYALMTNHYHILVRVPKRRELSNDELLARYRRLYPNLRPQQVRMLAAIQADMARGGEMSKAWRERQLRQMFDVSRFNKLLKMRFSMWYNKTHKRIGTFWSERFKSVLVESGEALQSIAAYIDLNCVRAGVVKDPKQYRYCGYSDALSGEPSARRGFSYLFGRDWVEIAERYRCLLVGLIWKDGRDAEAGGIKNDGPDSSGEADGGMIEWVFGRRVSSLVDSVVVGGEAFVNSIAACLPEKGRREAKLVTDLAGTCALHTLSRLKSLAAIG